MKVSEVTLILIDCNNREIKTQGWKCNAGPRTKGERQKKDILAKSV